MLPKSYRLPSFEILPLLKEGRRAGASPLQAVFRPSQNTLPRLVIVVPVRVDKRAVVRNRNKRLIRESLRHLLSQIATNRDIAILVKTDVSGQKQPEVEASLKALLSSAHLLR